jgi:cell division protein FtsQ
VLFLKRGIIVLSVLIFTLLIVLGIKLSAGTFAVKNILVSGNSTLEEGDIVRALNIRKGESLFRLSFTDLEKRLKRIAWIKKVAIRKQFPDTLKIEIEETTPKALLRLNSQMFLVDGDGNVLEEVEETSTSFLPVIVGIDPEKDKGGILEALKLVDAISEKSASADKSDKSEKNAFINRERKEIMLEAYGLAMNLDGEVIKVGYGRYAEKLGRWRELEPEARKKNQAIEYIDLRFDDRVIVKLVEEVKAKNQITKTVKKKS